MELLQGATQEKLLETVWNYDKDVLLFNINLPSDITLTEGTIISQTA